MTVEPVDDVLWSAVGDPIRRRMLDLLVDGAARTSTTLSQRLPVTRQAVAKHLAVLERAGLVRVRAEGRERIYDVDRDRLATAITQLARVGASWDRRLDRIAALAEDLERRRQGRRPPA